ncbi:NAD(P)/FAD-dependent oxidoreductase [Bradyrhizobium sp. 83002]|uniref:NAD(P)/FAD-dependent oxidoreductase n=1 Tax=Bradyrhizobium aeschynomenes TaxID=2734909 RepID=UPI001556D966|nr:tryptophan 7-halogenase [Bradyrhizobium aeschynomenes]NPU13496.1 NAD(P)/FAD-dependent oxidoreductase [Bradyrhizobium aeschynomenes]
MIEADVVVVGCGPAGATTALNLAPFRRVLVLERNAAPAPRIGESVPGAIRRLLADMGLWDAFAADRHAPCYVRRSVWGGAAADEQDSIRDPLGHGWHLDRVRFETMLRTAATARGAAVLSPAHPIGVAWEHGAWQLRVAHRDQRLLVRAPLLIDAGGRSSTLLRPFGGRRNAGDKLLCGWVQGTARRAADAGVTFTAAEPEGWWYTAPLPGDRRVLAFHTDADLGAASDTRSATALLARAARLPELGAVLAASGFAPDASSGVCAAHSAALAPPAGEGWLAAGDAALAFDPLSSQGLFHALYTGLAAAEAAHRHLDGDAAALPEYATGLAAIRQAYDDHLVAWYGQERRFTAQPFWRRRHNEDRRDA